MSRGKKYYGEFAVYKGDEIIAIGTAEECAEKLGVTPKYIRWMTTPSGKKRIASRKKTILRIIQKMICSERGGTCLPKSQP